ncbi:DUF2268 domain-containing putative Zn-dependent protease [Streptomyces lydicus]
MHVVVVLGDPDDAHLTGRSAGYFGVGGIPGAIQLVIWPTDTSLKKTGDGTAHELHHNVRYAKSGLTAAQSTALSAREILTNAGVPRGA